MGRKIFPSKIYFSDISVNQKYGYVTRDYFGNIKFSSVSSSEYNMNTLADFTRIELDMVSATLFFKLDNTDESILFIAKTGESADEILTRVINYTELVNRTVVSVYENYELVGSMFPPANTRENFYIFFPHHNYCLDVDRRIDTNVEGDYKKLSPKMACDIDLDPEEDICVASLILNEVPVLYLPYNPDSFGLNRMKRQESLGNALLTYYTCAYAHSLMRDDEMLLVNDNLDYYTLCGISVANENVREIRNVSPVVAASYILRQPFMSINCTGFSTFIPVNIEGISMWHHIERGHFFHSDYQKIKNAVFDAVEGIYENDGENQYEDYRKIFIQPFGYNGHLNFSDKIFANDLLNWF